ncbi:MAG TPA: DnaA/Hda family protein [Leptospiraceae bacterium]|nr:hypothetical protein [Leptospirales bacterium]HMU82308.1 DnaA/Hda family protein [Leptospiraceae bacterium]HMX57212.1 DnaA/Hda family protein [Leptospiraceae bacterium]HMZ36234.1 DnaA/Hda family protein [Leptospiraceae bacterium]HNE23147.1 DnaA/Hda family protein [Leptospiraceae bacterium]
MRHKQALSETSERRWNIVLDELRREIPPPLFRAFIAPVSVSCENEDLHIIAPDENKRRHLDKHYLTLLESAWRKQASTGRIRLLTLEKEREQLQERAQPIPVSSHFDFLIHERVSPLVSEMLNLNFRAPLYFLHGETSTGKTELMRQIETRAKAAGQTVRRTGLDGFIVEFAAACKRKSTVDFRKSWKDCRVVMIDDLQFLKPGAKQTREELRHLAEHSLAGNLTLILAADVPLRQIHMEEDLRSRLAAGAHIQLPPPDRSMRIRLFERFCKEAGVTPQESLSARAARSYKDPRALRSLALQLSVDPAAGDRIPAHEPEFSSILRHTAAFCGLPESEIMGDGQSRRTVGARRMAMVLVAELMNRTPTQIARLFNRSGHTSVLYAMARMKKDLEEDLFIANQLAELRRLILAD